MIYYLIEHEPTAEIIIIPENEFTRNYYMERACNIIDEGADIGLLFNKGYGEAKRRGCYFVGYKEIKEKTVKPKTKCTIKLKHHK